MRKMSVTAMQKRINTIVSKVRDRVVEVCVCMHARNLRAELWLNERTNARTLDGISYWNTMKIEMIECDIEPCKYRISIAKRRYVHNTLLLPLFSFTSKKSRRCYDQMARSIISFCLVCVYVCYCWLVSWKYLLNLSLFCLPIRVHDKDTAIFRWHCHLVDLVVGLVQSDKAQTCDLKRTQQKKKRSVCVFFIIDCMEWIAFIVYPLLF